MIIEIPEDIWKAAGLTEKECRIELATHLYGERRISIAQALQLSGLSRLDFEGELRNRKISLYTVEDLESDISTLKDLGRL